MSFRRRLFLPPLWQFAQTNTGDLVQELGAGEYETQQEAGWGEGDWTGDGLFGTGDLVVVIEDGGYEMGPRPDAPAVPEPSAFTVLISVLSIGAMGLRNRRT